MIIMPLCGPTVGMTFGFMKLVWHYNIFDLCQIIQLDHNSARTEITKTITCKFKLCYKWANATPGAWSTSPKLTFHMVCFTWLGFTILIFTMTWIYHGSVLHFSQMSVSAGWLCLGVSACCTIEEEKKNNWFRLIWAVNVRLVNLSHGKCEVGKTVNWYKRASATRTPNINLWAQELG